MGIYRILYRRNTVIRLTLEYNGLLDPVMSSVRIVY